MVPNLGSSRGESTAYKIGFPLGNVKERLTRGTERTTGLMVGYEVMEVSRLLAISLDHDYIIAWLRLSPGLYPHWCIIA